MSNCGRLGANCSNVRNRRDLSDTDTLFALAEPLTLATMFTGVPAQTSIACPSQPQMPHQQIVQPLPSAGQ